MPRTVSRTSHGHPSSPISPTMRQAPWSTAMPVRPGSKEVRQSRSAGTTRTCTCAVDSSPGTVCPSACASHAAWASGKACANSSRVSPERFPTSYSRSRASGSTASPLAAATCSAVCMARARSLDQSLTGSRPASTPATHCACACPRRLSGTSAWPCARPSAFQSVSPCRTRTRVRPGPRAGGGAPASAGGGTGDVGREVDQGAVAPQPLQRVELPLLLVLHVDDDVAVVDQHPPTVPLALATDRLLADVTELVLDLVHDRLHLAVVGRGG